MGLAPLLSVAEKIDSDVLIGGKNKAEVTFWIKEFSRLPSIDIIFVTTDDGSYGVKGFVTTALAQLVERGEKIDLVYAIGPVVMMKSVADATRPLGLKTIVSLNPIMVDGTGMCGGCRLTLIEDGKRVTKFACVDGPDFNGYEVDFDEAMSRGRMYFDFERHAYEETCNLLKGAN